MTEQGDVLILNYVGKAADAAHGVLRPGQRIDFTRRLRARIEEERHSSQDVRRVSKVLARLAWLRRAAMLTANPMTTGGRDARTVVKNHPREIAALMILMAAALLEFFNTSGVMFMIGAGAGVAWRVYRLLDGDAGR